MMQFSTQQLDALCELINVSVGQAAGILNSMLKSYVALDVPYVDVLGRDGIQAATAELGIGEIAAIRLPFQGVVQGFASLLFPPQDASKIADLLVGQTDDTTDLDAVRISTLQEVGNVILNTVMGTIANLLEEHLEFFIPTFVEGTLLQMLHQEMQETEACCILARITFRLEEHQITGNLMMYFEVGSVKPLIEVLENFIARDQ